MCAMILRRNNLRKKSLKGASIRASKSSHKKSSRKKKSLPSQQNLSIDDLQNSVNNKSAAKWKKSFVNLQKFAIDDLQNSARKEIKHDTSEKTTRKSVSEIGRPIRSLNTSGSKGSCLAKKSTSSSCNFIDDLQISLATPNKERILSDSLSNAIIHTRSSRSSSNHMIVISVPKKTQTKKSFPGSKKNVNKEEAAPSECDLEPSLLRDEVAVGKTRSSARVNRQSNGLLPDSEKNSGSKKVKQSKGNQPKSEKRVNQSAIGHLKKSVNGFQLHGKVSVTKKKSTTRVSFVHQQENEKPPAKKGEKTGSASKQQKQKFIRAVNQTFDGSAKSPENLFQLTDDLQVSTFTPNKGNMNCSTQVLRTRSSSGVLEKSQQKSSAEKNPKSSTGGRTKVSKKKKDETQQNVTELPTSKKPEVAKRKRSRLTTKAPSPVPPAKSLRGNAPKATKPNPKTKSRKTTTVKNEISTERPSNSQSRHKKLSSRENSIVRTFLHGRCIDDLLSSKMSPMLPPRTKRRLTADAAKKKSRQKPRGRCASLGVSFAIPNSVTPLKAGFRVPVDELTLTTFINPDSPNWGRKLPTSTPIVNQKIKKSRKTLLKSSLLESNLGGKKPTRGSLKRKRWLMNLLKEKNEGYEDDLFESDMFDDYKEVIPLEDDSDVSTFSIATPKIAFPITPNLPTQTPRFRDCYSPMELLKARKVAEEVMHRRNKKRKSDADQPAPQRRKSGGQASSAANMSGGLLPEKKRLEFLQLMKSLPKEPEEEESDVDDYFSDMSP